MLTDDEQLREAEAKQAPTRRRWQGAWHPLKGMFIGIRVISVTMESVCLFAPTFHWRDHFFTVLDSVIGTVSADSEFLQWPLRCGPITGETPKPNQ